MSRHHRRLGDALDPELGHDVRPVHLDGADADPELVRDRLVRAAAEQGERDVELARGEPGEPVLGDPARLAPLQRRFQPVPGRDEGGGELRRLDRFFEEV
jgi:hypothetical protein